MRAVIAAPASLLDGTPTLTLVVRRIQSIFVNDIDEVATRVAAQPGPLIMIFDADNTLVPQGASRTEFARHVEEAIGRFERLESVARVIVISNGPERGSDRVIARVNKPWTTRKRLGIRGSKTPIWVVGDQVVSDGFLAWRLGAVFLHCAIDPDDDFPGQAKQRRLGRFLAPLIFRKKPFNGPPHGT
jgi:predicted HAD superfamily phosphohydrolase YqeG